MAFLSSWMLSYLTLVSPSFPCASASETQYLNAYNVTNFLDEHPGGEEVLLAAAGKDASEEFEKVGHGSAARLMLDEFYVGEVDPSTNPTPAATILTPPQPEYDSGKTLESINKILYLLVPLGIMAVAIGFRFYN